MTTRTAAAMRRSRFALNAPRLTTARTVARDVLVIGTATIDTGDEPAYEVAIGPMRYAPRLVVFTTNRVLYLRARDVEGTTTPVAIAYHVYQRDDGVWVYALDELDVLAP